MDINVAAVSDPKEVDLQQESKQPTRKPRLTRRWWRWLILLAILSCGAYLLRKGRENSQSRAAQGAAKSVVQSVPVEAAAARKGDISVYLNGLGSVTPFNTVTVKSRVDGQLIKGAFREGQFVHQGDVLAEIDPRPFEVQLSQAEGQLARDQAQLNNAKIDLARYQVLFRQDSIPKQQLDTQAATVGQFEGAIKADQALIDNARLQLIYCHITAPISGRIGLRLVDAGNMVHANDPNGIVVVTQVQPIAVLFTLPEDSLPPVLKKLRAGERLPVDAYDRSGMARIAGGALLTVDNQIDPNTGTLRLKAVFKNQDDTLFPNQFVNVKLLIDVKKSSVIVPGVAVQRGPQGAFVYVVKEDKTVEVRQVAVGTMDDSKVSIEKGLSPGELVVVDGLDKLRAGSKVRLQTIDNSARSRRSDS